MAGCAGGSYAIMWTDNLPVSPPTRVAVGLTAGARSYGRVKPGVAAASAAGSPQRDRARGASATGSPARRHLGAATRLDRTVVRDPSRAASPTCVTRRTLAHARPRSAEWHNL